MSSIYEICGAIDNAEFVDEDGVVNTELFDKITLDFKSKVDNIACLYKNLLSDSKAIKAEEAALSARRKSKERKAEGLKNLLNYALNRSGQQNKFESARVRISWRLSETVEVQEADFINWAEENGKEEFLRRQIIVEPDKAALKEALKKEGETEDIPFVDLNENYNIQIK